MGNAHRLGKITCPGAVRAQHMVRAMGAGVHSHQLPGWPVC